VSKRKPESKRGRPGFSAGFGEGGGEEEIENRTLAQVVRGVEDRPCTEIGLRMYGR